MMAINKNALANALLSAEGFLVEEDTIIDGIYYPCKPLYIEFLNLYPNLLYNISMEIASFFKKNKPNMIFAMESAILPLATLVTHELNIPLIIVRKPNYSGHEGNEPKVYLPDRMIKDVGNQSVFFDDAIWSGRSIMGFINILKMSGVSEENIQNIVPVFIIDFMRFPGGNKVICETYKEYVSQRICFLTYSELIKYAYDKGVISLNAYEKSLDLFK